MFQLRRRPFRASLPRRRPERQGQGQRQSWWRAKTTVHSSAYVGVGARASDCTSAKTTVHSSVYVGVGTTASDCTSANAAAREDAYAAQTEIWRVSSTRVRDSTATVVGYLIGIRKYDTTNAGCAPGVRNSDATIAGIPTRGRHCDVCRRNSAMGGRQYKLQPREDILGFSRRIRYSVATSAGLSLGVIRDRLQPRDNMGFSPRIRYSVATSAGLSLGARDSDATAGGL